MTIAAFFRMPVRTRPLARLAGAGLLALGCTGGSADVPSAPLTANAPPVLESATPGDSALTVEVGQVVVFEVRGSDPDGSTLSYQFFLDGERVAAEATFTLAPDAPGARSVEARVSDGVHVVRRRWRVTVTPDLPRPPVAALAVAPDSGSAPLEVTVRLTGGDEDGSVRRWELDADGDGSYEVDAGQPPAEVTSVFESGGTFLVRARVTDDDGLVTLAEHVVRVTENLPPLASLAVSPRSGPVPLQVRVTGSGTDPEGALALYELDADGDGAFEIAGSAPLDTTLVFTDYRRDVEIGLRVTDAGGQTAEERVTVEPLPDVDPARSTLSQTDTGRLRADGQATRRISLAVVDPAGTPLPGVEVELRSSRNGGPAGTVDRLNPEGGLTDAQGRLETLFSTTSSSSLMGDAVVTATAGGRDLDLPLTVQFSSAVSAANSGLSCPLSSVHVAGSASQPNAARVRATVRDSANQPLADLHVRLGTKDLSLYRVSPAEGRTDANGTFAFMVSSDVPQTSTFVDLYADGLKTSAICTVSFDP